MNQDDWQTWTEDTCAPNSMAVTAVSSPSTSITVATVLTSAEFRDYIIRAYEMAACHFLQSDTEMRRRIAKLLGEAIARDDVIKGFLGYGGPCADRDILTGSADLGEGPR